jgi:hypothetical protein
VKLTLPILLALIQLSCAPADQIPGADPFSSRHGPYLGQEPPGLTPEVFAPGLISLEDRDEVGLAVAPGGREIFFYTVERVEGGGPPTVSIYETRERDGAWTTPEVAPFSGEFMDAYPAIHPDGSRIFFQSNRPIDAAESEFEYNIWYADRGGDGWSAARPVGRPINGRAHTGGPSVTRDGTLYFTQMDFESGVQEIYRSEYLDDAYQEPVRLPDAVNSSLQNFDSYVDPDERFLIFPAFERQGHENNPGDLRVTYRDEAGHWSQAMSLGPPIFAEGQFGSVTISADGRYIFFTRAAGATAGSNRMGLDIYWVDATVVSGKGTPG